MAVRKKHKRIFRIRNIILFVLSAFFIISLFFIDNRNIDYQKIYLNPTNNASIDKSEIKFIHLSDMHFPNIKTDLDILIAKIDNEKPDFVAITGDLIDDSAKIKECGVFDFIDKLKSVAPIYYVNGNHENRKENSYELYDYLQNSGVINLGNRSVNIKIKGKGITIMGLSDGENYSQSLLDNNLEAENNYKILLSHHPEKWANYISSAYKIRPDLVLSGHAHGGQVRLPFVGGVVAPNQGLFPKYESGLYEAKDVNTKMVVSRGIGNSLFPFRVNNKPHVPIISVLL